MDFLKGSAAAEMPLSFEIDALAAQAVAAYTYYGRIRDKNRADPDENLKGADFSADVSKWEKYATKEQMQERWGDNFDAYYEKLTQAAEKANGYVLTYEGELFLAYAKEAVAFALMADRCAMGMVNTLPGVTGAARAAVMGKLSLPPEGIRRTGV